MMTANDMLDWIEENMLEFQEVDDGKYRMMYLSQGFPVSVTDSSLRRCVHVAYARQLATGIKEIINKGEMEWNTK